MGGGFVPSSEGAQFDGVGVVGVDGGAFAAVVVVFEGAPAGAGGVAHVEVGGLPAVERAECPVPAARGLAAGAAHVHVASGPVGFA